ncbi:DnaT-like ssDNA-binding protein [Tistrella sp. BH-R2-4]|uniref:DnaT-like ssDNA-binding protein n=1 Tax=Tistrella arctica TaxID=3133430 RepID=A0ABU9YD48_9PROT
MTITIGVDSYADLAFADAHHAARGRTAWATATEAARMAALIEATSHIDAFHDFMGRPADAGQPLAWPRIDTRMCLDGVAVPPVVARACVELALAALDRPLAEQAAGPAARRLTLGDVAIDYGEAGGAGAPAGTGGALALAARLLAPLAPPRHRRPLVRT